MELLRRRVGELQLDKSWIRINKPKEPDTVSQEEEQKPLLKVTIQIAIFH